MLQFVCDSCDTVKDASDVWVLGLAAEAVGAASARREVTVLSSWDRANAVHPFAVHFCCLECKDDYMSRLFGPETTTETKSTRRTPVVEEIVVKQHAPKKKEAARKARRKSA